MVGYRFLAEDGSRILLREPRSTDARAAMKFINAFVGEDRSGINIAKEKTLKEEREWLK